MEARFLLAVLVQLAPLRSGEIVGFAEAGSRSARGERVPESSGKAGSCAGCFFRIVPLPIAVASGAASWLVPFVLSGVEGRARSGGAHYAV